jgi:hypothetical protein
MINQFKLSGMKKMIHFSSIIFLLLSFINSSCKKEEKAGEGQVEFTLATSDAQSSLKAASAAASVVVTIEDASGKVVKNSEKINIYSMSGSYITQPISLVSGSYKLTRFLVLDASNNVLYASPLEGSSKASLVQQPLPIAFSARTNAVTKLIPEVLNATESTPETFGYTTFSFNVVGETFDFLVGAFIYNEGVKNYQLTDASLTISNGSTPVSSIQLKGRNASSGTTVYDSLGVTTKVTLPENYDEFTLVITKPGYKTYEKTFSKAELKLHYKSVDKGPLVVVLDPEPVEETGFYIRGNFGSEYLNYTMLRINNYVYTYTNPVSSNTHFIAYEKDTINWCRTISIFTSSSVGNFSTLQAPFDLPSWDGKVYGELQFSTGNANPKFGPNDGVNYLGVAGTDATSTFFITVETSSNKIISGKFHGVIQTMTGVKITVTNGEFRGKLKDVLY